MLSVCPSPLSSSSLLFFVCLPSSKRGSIYAAFPTSIVIRLATLNRKLLKKKRKKNCLFVQGHIMERPSFHDYPSKTNQLRKKGHKNNNTKPAYVLPPQQQHPPLNLLYGCWLWGAPPVTPPLPPAPSTPIPPFLSPTHPSEIALTSASVPQASFVFPDPYPHKSILTRFKRDICPGPPSRVYRSPSL